MSDQFENDVEATDDASEAGADAAPENEILEPTDAAVAEMVEDIREDDDTGEAPDDDDFFAEEAAAEIPAVDPMKVVTIQTTSASDKYVEVEGPTPMVDLIHKSGLQFAGDFTCFLNGAEITLTTVIPGGSTVTIAGKVKGG